MKIDLFTFLSTNSAEYAEFLKYTCEKFMSGKHKINWKCVESVGCDRIPDGYKLVGKSEDAGQVSMNHAKALKLAQNYIESEYVIFVDADVAILYRDWDQVIINELNEYDCFGGAFGDWFSKYQKFPSVYFFAFRSHVLDKVKLDFRPKLKKSKPGDEKLHVDKCSELNEKNAGYYSMEPGQQMHYDTGWDIPRIIKKAGLTHNFMPADLVLFEEVFEDVQQRKLWLKTNKRKDMSEWYYNGKVFAGHKHASTAHPINSGLGKAWKRRVDVYIRNYEEEMVWRIELK